MEKDNCIAFDEIAEIYDETRPFLESRSKVFDKISDILIDKFSEKREIFVLDAGTGTGRLALKFAESFQNIVNERGCKIKLKLICVDKSDAMLEKFNKKKDELVKDTSFTSIQFEIKKQDIRDLLQEEPKYDVIIAHWLFHTIFDWSTTLYSLTQLIQNKGLILTFDEDSELYNAIDGNYENINFTYIKKFWDLYHTYRKIALKDCFIPARNRIGSRVKDRRINTLLNSLGWSNNTETENNVSDTWSKTYNLDQITKNIIEKRAFTNMRLSHDIEGSKFDIKEFYKVLTEQLGEKYGEEVWEVEFKFRFKCYTFIDNDDLKEYRTLLNIIKSTIGQKKARSLDAVYNRESFWKRIYDLIWSRINYSVRNKRNAVFGLVPEVELEQILYAFCKFSDFLIKDSSNFRYFDKEKISLLNIWNNLTENIEIFEPIIISYNGFDYSINHYSVFNHLRIDIKNLEPLKEKSFYNRRIELTKLLASSDDIKQLHLNIENIGLVPFNSRESLFNHFNGLIDIMKIENGRVKYVYIFPYQNQKKNDKVGLLLLCSKQLSFKAFDYINLLFDILLNEYINEVSE
jgi:ubiquinone/menaquinone biosynthesis C-methylase UbiE